MALYSPQRKDELSDVQDFNNGGQGVWKMEVPSWVHRRSPCREVPQKLKFNFGGVLVGPDRLCWGHP